MRRIRPYRLLLISDIHMSNSLPQAELLAEGVSDRLKDQLDLWDRVHQTGRDEKPDRMLILGDLFDKSLVDAITLTYTVEAIVASQVPVDILPGNHDAVSTQGGRFTVEAFGKMGAKNVRYIGSASGHEVIEHEWLRMWPIEYSTSIKANERIARARSLIAGRPGVDVLLLHHSIIGCTHLGWTCDDGLDASEVVDGFNHVFSGHFHEAQRFGPESQGLYLGAPMHHRLDDEGRAAGYWIIDLLPDGTKEEQFIDGGAPKMHSTLWAGSAAKTRHNAERGDYLRVVVEATHAEWTILRPGVDEYVARLRAEGIRATRKHRPVYRHTEHIAPRPAGEKVSLDAIVSNYVDAAGVDTGLFDPELLKRIGREALEESRRR